MPLGLLLRYGRLRDVRTGPLLRTAARTAMDAAFMSFQRRGWGIHVVSAEPERAAGVESSVTGMLRENRNIGGHTPACPPIYDQQKLSGIAFMRRGRGGSQGVAENGWTARNRCAAGSAEAASGGKIH